MEFSCSTICFCHKQLILPSAKQRWLQDYSIGVWGYEILGVLTNQNFIVYSTKGSKYNKSSQQYLTIYRLINYDIVPHKSQDKDKCTSCEFTPPCNFFLQKCGWTDMILFINYKTRNLWIISGTKTRHNVNCVTCWVWPKLHVHTVYTDN